MVKKAVKQKKQNQKGGITSVEAPMPVGQADDHVQEMRTHPDRLPVDGDDEEEGLPQVRRGSVSKEKLNPEGTEAPRAAAKAPETPRAEAPRAAKPEKAPREEKAPKAEKGQKGGGGQKGQKGQKQAEEAVAEKAKPVADPPGDEPRLKKLYRETAVKDLREEFAYKSVMQVPRLSEDHREHGNR